jgi:ABC-type Na+ efflux pump permease subunit
MRKILQVAGREFLATVATKGFLIGIVLVPVIILISILGIKAMVENEKPPRVVGEVAVIDPTGEVADGLREYLAPEAIAGRRADLKEKVADEAPAIVSEQSDRAMDAVLGDVPELDVVDLGPLASPEDAKKPLLETDGPNGKRLALVVVHEDAVVKREGEDAFGKYDLFVREKLDDRIEGEIKEGMWNSIVDARVQALGMDRQEIESITRIGKITSTTVTTEGEKETSEVLNALLPAGFLLLLFISVMSSGQYILTSTVEEKSSRVVEVLLSAVSPMELMAGKILGQMCVGFVILAVYAGMGIGALAIFAMMGALDLSLLVYTIFFYLIAYFIVGSLMAAIGSAVNEMREAQTFMAPVMMVLMIPWILWMPISRDPNSLFATVLSYVPPMNCFVMLLRLSSTTPPPWWHALISIVLGLAAVYAALWFAGKVFRIGLLMYGKPPNFKTLIRWVRMA